MRSKIKLQGEILGLDLGKARTGVARLHINAGIAEPLTDIVMHGGWVADVEQFIKEYQSEVVIVGMPRTLEGADSDQTVWAKQMKEKLERELNTPVMEIDEAGTTKLAETRALAGQSIDGVSAGILLEDFLLEVKRGNIDGFSV